MHKTTNNYKEHSQCKITSFIKTPSSKGQSLDYCKAGTQMMDQGHIIARIKENTEVLSLCDLKRL